MLAQAHKIKPFRFGFGFGGTGKKSNNKQFDDYGEPFGKSDVITCLLDLDNGQIKFLKNGSDLGNAFTINKQALNSAFFPAVVLKVVVTLVWTNLTVVFRMRKWRSISAKNPLNTSFLKGTSL